MAKHRIRKREGERWRSLAAFLQDSRKFGGEKSSCPSCRAFIARSHSTLTLGANIPCGAPHVPEQDSSSLCPSSCAVVTNGVDIPPAWRCESCRQTTLVDGVVPRSARRISPLSFHEAVVFDQKSLWSAASLTTCVLNSAGTTFRLEQSLKTKLIPKNWKKRHFCHQLERRPQHWR